MIKGFFKNWEPIFRPFFGSTSGSSTTSSSSVTTSNQGSQSSHELPVSRPEPTNSIPSNRVIPWSPLSSGGSLVDDDNMSTSELLLSFGIVRPPRSSGAPQTVVPELARPLPLPLTPCNFPTLPTSPGLLSYYCHNEHLAYLQRGILPEYAVTAFAPAIPSTQSSSTVSSAAVVTPSSSSAVVVALSKDKSLPDLRNYKKTGRFRQDALESLQSQVFLPPSPVKPLFISEEQFIELCVVATFLHLMKKGAPLSDLILLQNLLRGWPGKNIDNLQCLIATLAPLRTSVDFLGNIPQNLLDSMSFSDIERLSSVGLPKDASLVHEMLAKATLNSQQALELTYTGDSRTPMVEPWLYNNSGNRCPDYFQVLKQAVGPYTHMAYDYKFTRSLRGNCDVIKGCSDDLEYQMVKSHKQLTQDVSAILKEKATPSGDQVIAKAFLKDINQNRLDYLEHQDLNKQILSYNALRDTYCDFLIRNKVGMNLIVPISTENVVVDAGLKESFSTTFQHFYQSENSSLLSYLNDHLRSQNGAMLTTKELILDYALNSF